MIKAVIFDMDGVLVDSEPKNLEQIKGFMHAYGADVEEAFLHSLVGSSFDDTYRYCMEYMHVEWSKQEFARRYEEYVNHHMYDYSDILNEGVRELLLWLRKQGIRTAIASSSPQKRIHKMEQNCELKGHFNIKVSGELFEESKPNPDIYFHTAERLGLKPEECLAIEDSAFGITAAKRAGMRVLAYLDQRYGMNQQEADHIVHTMNDIRLFVQNQ